MPENERDTHFAGFAELVCSDERLARLLDNPYYCAPSTRQEIVTLIAQRAYDLVAHTIYHVSPYHLDALDYDEIPPRIPDMTTWPEEK